MKGTLRVIAGSVKGLHLKTVPGDSTRPITDIVKEALFNIIASEIQGNKVLDLFGGTGAVSIEALSRGAKSAVIIDKSQTAVSIVKQNLDTARFTSRAKVICGDAFSYLSSQVKDSFDLIYIAPPQYKLMWQKALKQLDLNPGWLGADGQVIVQINPNEWAELSLENLQVFDTRKYGDTLLVFYEHKAVEQVGE
ncbi:MAG TPA: 16S rRNA (guanine(966)-N(2))-methyltransferase RsmD [Anaerolineaceae bacterium]|nr:16S rRNA (guanine(966)-N(2))-methyltransferase RsmD [Anaerolineaceae bacterium]